MAEPKERRAVDKSASLPPNTTAEADKVVASQRNINLIWETNQARMSWLVVSMATLANFLVVVGSLIMIMINVWHGKDITANQLVLLLGSLASLGATTGTIMGFYFSRTNHVNTGGVGPKTNEPR